MNRNLLQILILLFSVSLQGQNSDEKDFDFLNESSEWHLEFNDACTKNWQSKWFLDGLLAEIENTKQGMTFSAGPVEGDDASHAVLWTKNSFKGDVKIEYNYTRTDTKTKWVNILYIQATGIDPYAEDIFEWKELREIPSMKKYFMNMKALHISYAAYNGNNLSENIDYVRARQYPVLPGQDFSTTTEIPIASFETGLFKSGETYQITVIKTNEKLYFKVDGKSDSKLFFWDLRDYPSIYEGRIGLRHMYTRSARYKDFNIYIKK